MDSAAIEQMNKLRKSLGLPLLGGPQAEGDSSDGPKFKEKRVAVDGDGDGDDDDDEPASTLESREAAGHSNYQELRREENKRIEREQRKRAIQKARDAAARFQKLEGKGLGDVGVEDDNGQDAKAWLKGQKARQREIERERARKLEEELAERERVAAINYTSSDLVGVQVAHEIDDFDDSTGDQILTLKDQEIGKDEDEEDGDVLESADLVAREKLNDKLEAKKKLRYDIHDDEKQALLSQYDDKKRKAFTLDAQGSSLEERENKRQAIGEMIKNAINLDILKADLVSDYQEVKIKKPKKTIKKNKRQKADDDDDIYPINNLNEKMDVDGPEPRSRNESNINDDEDLSSALAFSRRAALKKKRVKPEDLVKHLKDEPEIPPLDPEGGIILDDTTTFLDNLEARPREEFHEPTKRSPDTETADDKMQIEDESVSDANQAYNIVDDNEHALLDAVARADSGNPNHNISSSGFAEEKTLSSGLGAALELLKSRGVLKESDTNDKNSVFRARQKFISEQQLREHDADQRARAQRERERASGKFKGLSRTEQEERARWTNEQRAQQLSVQAAAAFNKDYKPDVNLKYVDDDGRLLDQKAAFKHLSHQFHGKGSGKQKTEKHLKKVDEEKRREAKSVLDTGRDDDRGMQRAQGTLGKRDKLAGVRLG